MRKKSNKPLRSIVVPLNELTAEQVKKLHWAISSHGFKYHKRAIEIYTDGSFLINLGIDNSRFERSLQIGEFWRMKSCIIREQTIFETADVRIIIGSKLTFDEKLVEINSYLSQHNHFFDNKKIEDLI